MKKLLSITLFSLIGAAALFAADVKSWNITDFIRAEEQQDVQPAVLRALDAIRESQSADSGMHHELIFGDREWHFNYASTASLECYISNHDQDNPRRVAFPLTGFKNLTIDGKGARFLFHGRILPFTLIEGEGITLKNFSIDFPNPQIVQMDVIEGNGLTVRLPESARYRMKGSRIEFYGEGWASSLGSGIAFDGKTKRIIPEVSDVWLPLGMVKEVAPQVIEIKGALEKKLVPGVKIAARGWARPAPGIFIDRCLNTLLENVKVHYAEGMGLLAQLSENITLDGFQVALKGDDDPRVFTTQADATHFSSCKGVIRSVNGFYEGMMDDAINIHGTYLKISKVKKDRVVASYQHPQAWGFEWGRVGDEVQLINAKTMDRAGTPLTIKEIRSLDKPINRGSKKFEVIFDRPLPRGVRRGFGMENITWTPEVVFSNNRVRNNRARGTLFSTPKKTVVENNSFEYVSGSSILLAGDCNGWFETGSCRDVLIRGNRFINPLASLFQFTNAVISIYPEIPRLKQQKEYFHSNIRIEDNEFVFFDRPLLYAKSVDGITFKGNKVTSSDYTAPFHWNTSSFLLEKCKNVEISENEFGEGYPFDPAKDIEVRLSPDDAVKFSE